MTNVSIEQMLNAEIENESTPVIEEQYDLTADAHDELDAMLESDSSSNDGEGSDKKDK